MHHGDLDGPRLSRLEQIQQARARLVRVDRAQYLDRSQSRRFGSSVVEGPGPRPLEQARDQGGSWFDRVGIDRERMARAPQAASQGDDQAIAKVEPRRVHWAHILGSRHRVEDTTDLIGPIPHAHNLHKLPEQLGPVRRVPTRSRGARFRPEVHE